MFKDMVECITDGGVEPVYPIILWRANSEIVLHDEPEAFDLFVSWLFHSPDFKVTKGLPNRFQFAC